MRSGILLLLINPRNFLVQSGLIFSPFATEDRNQIWQNRGRIKHSDNYPDAYITEDFAKAIQEERKVLIAMMKARENEPHSNAKVVGRYLFINNEKYNYKNIPSYLK